MTDLDLPSLIEKGREYAYIGLYDQAISTLQKCSHMIKQQPLILRPRLQEKHKSDADLAFEFYEVAHEVDTEIDQVQKLQNMVKDGQTSHKNMMVEDDQKSREQTDNVQ